MPAIYEVQTDKLIEKTAQELKKLDTMQPPQWAAFVKTGINKERPPIDPDWWYYRSASILRRVAMLGPIGVSKLRVKFSERRRRGHKPNHAYSASGNIIRKILQGLEKSNLVKKQDSGVHKGKVLTKQGAEFLNKVVVDVKGSPLVKKEKTKADLPKIKAAKKAPAKKSPSKAKPKKAAAKAEEKPAKKEEAKPEVKA